MGLDGVVPPLVQCPRILGKDGLCLFNHIYQVNTMRMSSQAKKILLVLLRDNGRERSPRLRGMTLKSMAMQIDGDEAFEAWGNYLKSEKDYSYGRTLKGLVAEGYVSKRRKRRGRENVYLIFEKGIEKAIQIRDEIQEGIREWAPLVGAFEAG